MRICVVGSGYVGLGHRCLPRRLRHECHLCRQRTRPRSTRSCAVKSPSTSQASRPWSARTATTTGSTSRPTSRTASSRPEAIFHRRRNPTALGRLVGPDLRPSGGRFHCREPQRLQSDRHQEHSADRNRSNDPRDRPQGRRRGCRLRGREQPGVPARRLGDRKTSSSQIGSSSAAKTSAPPK